MSSAGTGVSWSGAWSSSDAGGWPHSGSVASTNTEVPGNLTIPGQCVAITDPPPDLARGWGFIPGGQQGTGQVSVQVVYFSKPGCVDADRIGSQSAPLNSFANCP